MTHPFRLPTLYVLAHMRVQLVGLIMLLLGMVAPAFAAQPLQIYFIDVEGGQSTLVVTPARQTLLIDAGWAGDGGRYAGPGDPAKARDAGRIVAALRDAGVDRIDYLLVTHFHRDHMGGIPELAQLIPITTFVDHGNTVDPADQDIYDAYVPVRARGRHLQPKPGDHLPLKGLDVTIVSADRATLRGPLRGASKTNDACKATPLSSNDESGENSRSTGLVLTLGKFRFLDVGDLSGQPLFDLACPKDRIGPVDVYLVAHHGGIDAADPATLSAFRPRVAVVNNAPRKGGQRPTLQMLRSAREVDSWQMHVADGVGEDNASPDRIANLDNSAAHWLKVIAHADGSFSIVNQRTGAGKAYGVR